MLDKEYIIIGLFFFITIYCFHQILVGVLKCTEKVSMEK